MSRKVTKQAIHAFLNGGRFTSKNTTVATNADGVTELCLHGSPIARRVSDKILVTVAGWNTLTTRERLNGIPGVRVCNRRRQLYLNGKPWDGAWTPATYDARY